ncbi:putative S-adenosylmethionine-dependent methyltransferase At5g38780 [Senna tora]|uniref:Putative S-adenosylmethionine-dependent methyltransferase At5g38780 n=1 Tax=Senna tora TaxID=362788 RepID=A0A834TI90_9FABA|nr:putative S-adenosylmethionine-dependent methyltransferase At5g38780 [Senna tora]
MQVDEGINSVSYQSCPMNGGDGPNSYSNNSNYQRRLIEASKDLINEAIHDKLEIDSSCVNGSKPFGIADLGCSVGQNTFIAVQNIIEAVEKEYKAKNESNSPVLEFQVFFNDHSNNDFNSLFRSVPYSSRNYYAAAVAGSFYGRLFPNSTLHFVNCSCAVHWMSKVPTEVLDRESLAWNGNRIHYTTSSEKVYEAYAAQYKNDLECFLSVRAQELVGGGLMLIVVPGQSSHLVSQTPRATTTWLLESCLLEMVKMGSISQKQVDEFNIPIYFPTLKDMEEITKNNGNFRVERMGIVRGKGYIKPSVEFLVGSMRAVMEEILKQHFGDEVIEDLFERYAKKVAQNLDSFYTKFREYEDLFVILKRKMN